MSKGDSVGKLIEWIGLSIGDGLPVRIWLIVEVGLITRAALDESLPPAVILIDVVLVLVIVVDGVDWFVWRAAYMYTQSIMVIS